MAVYYSRCIINLFICHNGVQTEPITWNDQILCCLGNANDGGQFLVFTFRIERCQYTFSLCKFRQFRNMTFFRRRLRCRYFWGRKVCYEIEIILGLFWLASQLNLFPETEALWARCYVFCHKLKTEEKFYYKDPTYGNKLPRAYNNYHSTVRWRCESFLFRCRKDKPLARTRNTNWISNYLAEYSCKTIAL